MQRIHFVGIGGIGMSGIAEVLLNLSYKVSGSDLKRSAVTDRLAGLGATIFEGHAAENIPGADVVVTTSAVSAANPEVAEAHRRKIPVIQRAEMLAELMRLKLGIAVAGMHGKTTTTSMVAAVLAEGGLDPTVVVGGRVGAMGSNARLGKSEYLVAEADESDRSFLKLSPIHSIVTNLDREHMDTYGSMEDVEDTFIEFMDRVPFYGLVVACNDDDRLRGLLSRVRRRILTYGTREDSDFHISEIASDGLVSTWQVSYRGAALGGFRLNVPGRHNVLNATAALAIGVVLDVPAEKIRAGLDGFRGVDRRFQLRGEVRGVKVIDDYGHHPTEIAATLAAARQCGFHKIHVIFQPHRFTRTRDLLAEFACCFTAADTLEVLDVYAASELPIPGVTGEALAKAVRAAGTEAKYAASFAEAAQAAAARAREGDVILTLGAGNVVQVAPLVVDALAGQ